MTNAELRDDQCEKVYAFLQQHPRAYAGKETDCRKFVEYGADFARQYHRASASLRRGRVKKSGGQEGQAFGRSRGGFSTKIHANVDALGNPLRFLLTGVSFPDLKNWISACSASSALLAL